MEEANAGTVFLGLSFIVFLLFAFNLFSNSLFNLAKRLDEKEEEQKKNPKEKKKINFKKHLTIRNYLIALATLATVGILIIAIKLL